LAAEETVTDYSVLIPIVIAITAAIIWILFRSKFWFVWPYGDKNCDDECVEEGISNCIVSKIGFGSHFDNPDEDTDAPIGILPLIPGLGLGSGALLTGITEMIKKLKTGIKNNNYGLWIKVTYDECKSVPCDDGINLKLILDETVWVLADTRQGTQHQNILVGYTLEQLENRFDKIEQAVNKCHERICDKLQQGLEIKRDS